MRGCIITLTCISVLKFVHSHCVIVSNSRVDDQSEQKIEFITNSATTRKNGLNAELSCTEMSPGAIPDVASGAVQVSHDQKSSILPLTR